MRYIQAGLLTQASITYAHLLGELPMITKHTLRQYSNGFVRDSHPFPFSPALSGGHPYTKFYLLIAHIIIVSHFNVNKIGQNI